MLEIFLVVALVALVLGTLPVYPFSRNWGYGPSGGLGLVLLVLVIWLLWG